MLPLLLSRGHLSRGIGFLLMAVPPATCPARLRTLPCTIVAAFGYIIYAVFFGRIISAPNGNLDGATPFGWMPSAK